MPDTAYSKWLQPTHHSAQLSPLATKVVPEGKCVRKDIMLPTSKKQRGKKTNSNPRTKKREGAFQVPEQKFSSTHREDHSGADNYTAAHGRLLC